MHARILQFIVCTVFLSVSTPSLAALGDVDPSYGASGRFQGRLMGPPLADGRLLYYVQGGYARTDANGLPDPGFGTNGVRGWPADFEPYSGYRIGSAHFRDGSLIIAGTVPMADGRQYALLRLRADGEPDGAVAPGGIVTIPTSLSSPPVDRFVTARPLAQPDGKLLLLIAVSVSSSPYDTLGSVTLVRLLADGRPDSSFGQAGAVSIDGNGAESADLAILRDRRILIELDGVKVFLTEHGQADAGDPPADSSLGLPSQNWIIEAQQPDGALLVRAIEEGAAADSRMRLARLNEDGTVDRLFGPDGTGVLDMTLPLLAGSYVTAIHVDSAGRFLYACLQRRSAFRVYLARVSLQGANSGQLDRSFGAEGIVDLGDRLWISTVMGLGDGGVLVNLADSVVLRLLGGNQPSPGFLMVAQPLAFQQSDGKAVVTVERLAGSDGALQVRYSTVAVDSHLQEEPVAMPGTDYEPVAGELDWSDRDSSSKTIAIRLLSGASFQGTRTIVLGLSASAGSWIFGDPTWLAVTGRTTSAVQPTPPPSSSPGSSSGAGGSGGGGAAGAGTLCILLLGTISRLRRAFLSVQVLRRAGVPPLAVLLLLPMLVQADGMPGEVDPSFVYPRPVTLDPDSTNAIPLADGFLVVKSRDFDKAGVNSTLELTRIDEDGHVVTNFGSGGKVIVTMPGAVNLSTAVKGLLDGSMLLAGFQRKPGPVSDNLAAVARLDATGRLDPTFGIGGVATFDVPGQLDRIGAIDVLPDGRIVAGVWSEVARDPYGDCSTDGVSLVRLSPDGSAPESIYYRERNEFADNGCRNTMTLRVAPDQRFYFGSSVEIAEFSAPESSAWRPIHPYGCCLGPFAVDPALGPVWTYQSGYGGWLETAATLGAPVGQRTWFPESWFYLLGIPGPRTASLLIPDGDRPGWFLGVSSDGGVVGIAKLRHDGWLDTGWAGGSGMVRIEGTGRPNIIANEGLANDIRQVSIRAGGETMVVVTADGLIERRFAKSGPAHGAIHFAAGDVAVSEAAGSARIRVLREGGSDGAVSVDYRTLDAGRGYDCAYDACAQSGLDYVASTGRLDWGDGDSSERVITIPIVNDQQHEQRESFNVQLVAPTGGAVILGGDTWAVDIVDDDPVAPAGSGSGKNVNTNGGSGGGGATDPSTMLMLFLMFAAGAQRATAWKFEARKAVAALLAIGSMLLAGACAPTLETTNNARPTGEHQDAVAAIAADDAVVCKTELETGSRVRRHKICMTQSEWAAHTEAARRYTNSIERSRATQVGGDSLTPSTPTRPGG